MLKDSLCKRELFVGCLAIQYFTRKGFRSLAFLGIENLEWSLQRMTFSGNGYFFQYPV
jgi:hypothetical protein